MKPRLVDVCQHRIDLYQSCSFAPWDIDLELLGNSFAAGLIHYLNDSMEFDNFERVSWSFWPFRVWSSRFLDFGSGIRSLPFGGFNVIMLLRCFIVIDPVHCCAEHCSSFVLRTDGQEVFAIIDHLKRLLVLYYTSSTVRTSAHYRTGHDRYWRLETRRLVSEYNMPGGFAKTNGRLFCLLLCGYTVSSLSHSADDGLIGKAEC